MQADENVYKKLKDKLFNIAENDKKPKCGSETKTIKLIIIEKLFF